MADQAPKMGKKFFGYDRASVERMLLERDAMLKVAERRVQSAEAKTAKIEERLGELERRAREAEAAAAAAAAPTATPRERAEVLNMPREKSAAHAPEELVKAVTAAEASASQIIEAWTSTRHQISEADRLWRAVQDEVVRFSAWREDVAPLMETVHEFIQEARARSEEVPGRVQHALEPAVDAMVTVSEGMARFAAVSTPPLLPSPVGSSSEKGKDAAGQDAPDGSATDTNGGPSADEASEGDGGSDEDPMARVLSHHQAWQGDEGGTEAGQVDRLTEAAVARGVNDSPTEYFQN